jgi:hypothetical protein
MKALQFSFTKPAKISLKGSIVFLIRALARFIIGGRQRRSRPGDDSAGLEGAGKPVPRKPSPTHHLAAAKALPPSDTTDSLPKD